MDSVPYDFIEQTILLVAPLEVSRSPFSTLQGHWGRYAKVLDEKTTHIEVFVNLRLPDLYYYVDSHRLLTSYLASPKLSVDDLCQRKHVNVLKVIVSSAPDLNLVAEKIDEQTKEKLLRLLRRSNGLTTLIVRDWPNDAPALTTLLEALPRIQEITFHRYKMAENVAAVHSILEKHVQRRCLSRINFWDHPIPKVLFPVVLDFAKDPKFIALEGVVPSNEEDFAKELIRLFAANAKKRHFTSEKIFVAASPLLLDEFKKEIEDEAEHWPLQMKETPNGEVLLSYVFGLP
uniref:F-box domain-containing protein n=1 Tax=Steinernema glaseri TaxID=37863 RepID=A0A1I7ZGS7_9BILA